jgi:alkylation response protein AidB-like acyl-CoA dehydrogenase
MWWVSLAEWAVGGRLKPSDNPQTFDDVKVPVENLLGKINEGFKVLMTNL